jgi:hypothetical protein
MDRVEIIKVNEDEYVLETGIVPVVLLPPDTIRIEPGKLYIWDAVENLNLTLAPPTDDSVLNEYMVQFTSGTVATTLTLPSNIQWLSEPTINPNATYQLSIVNNLAVIGEWNNE